MDPAVGVAVLKVAESGWAPQVRRAERAVERVRATGYPTPAWLAVGTTASGIGYQVQERVAGASVATVDVAVAKAFIAVLEQQVGLDPDPGRSWNDFIRGELTGGFADLAESAVAAGEAGARLVAVCRDLARSVDDAADTRWPDADMVHGDFRPGNVLLDGGRVTGVIDIEAIGSGTRAFDYATLLTWGDIRPDALDRIVEAGVAAAGRAVLRACVAQALLDLVRFEARGLAGVPRGELPDSTLVAGSRADAAAGASANAAHLESVARLADRAETIAAQTGR